MSSSAEHPVVPDKAAQSLFLPDTLRAVKALTNRRFTGLLVLWACVPIGLLYLWSGIVQPLLFGTYQGDFQESYMRAAGRIAAGLDPYDLCMATGCFEPTGAQYVMPPLLAWLLQPGVGVNGHLLGIAVIIVLNLALALFLWCTLRALRVDDWQLATLLVAVALTFGMNGNVEEGQINPVLLALSGVWLLGWVSDRWWGGIALGAAVALKLIQAPVGVLLIVARRWSLLAAAAVTGLALWLLATPQYLLEYLFRVVPAISAGTGLFENQSPGGTITRLFQPDTFFGSVHGSPAIARFVTLVIALITLGVTLWVLRRPATSRSGRALEAAAIVAVTPMVVSYSWATHLVLLSLPLLVLIAWGVRRQDWTVLALVVAAYLLISLGHHLLQVLLTTGYRNVVVLRVLAETGVTGIGLLWLAALVAVRHEQPVGLRSQPRLHPEHQDPAGLPDEQRLENPDGGELGGREASHQPGHLRDAGLGPQHDPGG
jgi:hypothetical protein